MIKNRFYLFLSIVLLTFIGGCYIDFPETVNGSGNIKTEDRVAGSFTTLKVSSGIDVFITQGDTESIRVIADDNLLKFIRTEIYDNTLTISSRAFIRKARSKEVHIVYKKLDEINISSAGDVEGINRLTADELDINMSSAGDLNLEVEARSINIDISSAGNATLSGKVDELQADLSSVGDLDAFDLSARKARVNASSAGNARICASEEVDLNASSAGDIHYKGDPKTININKSSAGSIIKK